MGIFSAHPLQSREAQSGGAAGETAPPLSQKRRDVHEGEGDDHEARVSGS